MNKVWKINNCFKLNDIYTIYEGTHVSGLRVVYLEAKKETKQVASISIRTPAYNNKGTSHILEHCVGHDILQNERVASYCDNLLAEYKLYTLTDRTVYEYSSESDEIFGYILEATLNSIFSPSFYTEQEIFTIEAWRKEKENINGIVYNEMLNAINQPLSLLYKTIPFACNGCDYITGGIPKRIVDLSIEELQCYHQTYYVPSNCYIYMSSNKPVSEYLTVMEHAISEYKRVTGNSIYTATKGTGIELGERIEFWEGNKIVRIPSPSSFYQSDQYFYSINYKLRKPDNIIMYLVYNYIRMNLFHEKIETKYSLSKSILNTSIEKPYISFLLSFSKKEQMKEFYYDVTKIFETVNNFKDLVNYKKELVLEEPNIRKIVTDLIPYDIDIISFFSNMKGYQIEEGNLKSIIKENFQEIKNRSITVISPELKADNVITAKNGNNICCKNSSPKKESVAPAIKKSDEIEKKYDDLISEVDKRFLYAKSYQLGERAELYYHFPENVSDHSNYIYLYYDITELVTDNESITILQIVCKLLLNSIKKELGKYKDDNEKGMINSNIICFDDNNNPNHIKIRLMFAMRVPSGKERYYFDLIYQSYDKYCLKSNEVFHFLKKENDNFKYQMYANTEILLRRRLKSMCSLAGSVEDALSGVSYYELVGKLLKSKNIHPIEQRIQEIKKLCRFPMAVSLYGKQDSLDTVKMYFASQSISKCKNPGNMNIDVVKKNEGIIVGLPNQFIAQGYNYKTLNYNDIGIIILFSNLLKTKYMKEILERETGAYDCSLRHYSDGTLLFESLNDPGFNKTVLGFQNIPDYLEGIRLSSKELNEWKYIAMQRYIDGYVLGNYTTDNSTVKYFKHLTIDEVKKQLYFIKTADKMCFHKYIQIIQKIMDKSYLCVFGNQNTLEKNKALLRVISYKL